MPRSAIREDFRDALHAHDNLCDGAESCRRAVRIQVGRGVDVIKIATTGGVNSRVGAGLGQQMFDDEARAIVETAQPVRQEGRGARARRRRHQGRAARRRRFDRARHDARRRMPSRCCVKSGAYYVPTLSTVNGYIERLAANPRPIRRRCGPRSTGASRSPASRCARPCRAGVKIAFGTDAGVSKHGRNADEFELMVKHGMTPAAALQAATVNAADLLGLQAEVGTLEPGKRADLIAVDGDPLERRDRAEARAVRDEGRRRVQGRAGLTPRRMEQAPAFVRAVAAFFGGVRAQQGSDPRGAAALARAAGRRGARDRCRHGAARGAFRAPPAAA